MSNLKFKTMKNDANNFAKRTATQVKSILKSNNIDFDSVINDGDGNQFTIRIENTIKNKAKLDFIGFILLPKWHSKNKLVVKCF